MRHARISIARLIVAAPALVAASLAVTHAQTAIEVAFPGKTWEYVKPADLQAYGWSPDALGKTTEFIRGESFTTGLVVVDRGRVVYQYGDVQELSYLASARKSILSMLYGYWVENGTIKLDATLEELKFDDIKKLLPIEKKATVRDLLTARSGVFLPPAYGPEQPELPPRGSQRPGTYMLYANWDFNAAGGVFEQLTKREIYDEMQAQLAVPLQFEDWDRSAQQKAGDLTISKYPAYHLWLSTRDMARIGHLMLNEGAWNQRQIISRDWARRIVSVVTPLHEMNSGPRPGGYFGYGDGYFGYGHMWWVFDGPKAVGPFRGAYSAVGNWGQWITVFPSLKLVIAHKTKSIYGRHTREESWQRIIELLFEARGVKMPGDYPWSTSTSH